jgi:DNA-binding HxlR family transcriptional regulator
MKRRYDDACGAAHALDLVGDRWSLLVVRELMFGPKRFGEIRSSLPGISAKVLTERLEDLQAASILVRRRLPPPASAWVYELTEWGYASEPVFQALGQWAAQSPTHDPTLPMSAASLMLSFRTMIDSARAGGVNATIGFRFDEESFTARLDGGRIEIGRGEAAGPDLVLGGDPAALAAAVYGGVPLEALPIAVEGDRALARRFVTLFPLPPKASVTAATGLGSASAQRDGTAAPANGSAGAVGGGAAVGGAAGAGGGGVAKPGSEAPS